MKRSAVETNWGIPPWAIDFEPPSRPLPQQVDVAIIGGGFTGLAAAAWLSRLAPNKAIAVFESERIGAGASGRTGGMVLAETAAGDLPGLGDVLSGFSHAVETLKIDCDLILKGGWEIGRSAPKRRSPIDWNDSGRLRVVGEVPGGTVDPGRLVGGLAQTAHQSGAAIFEHSPVRSVSWGNFAELDLGSSRVRARQVVYATNAMELEESGLADKGEPKFTLAIATEPLDELTLRAIGLDERKPFYTADLPYLWGRVTVTNSVVWGAGLIHLENWRGLGDIDAAEGETKRLLDLLEERVHGLHPALKSIRITHRWGGPILITDDWRPRFAKHPRSEHGLVLGGYSGHGVALSVYLGCWAAEVLLEKRELPDWE